MTVDVGQFFNACNPTKTINYADPKERQYYVDFSSVRGGELIKDMIRLIELSDEPTCQLFTGYIGCGKSTELMRLKAELEQKKFHVVYFKAEEEVDLLDVEVSDILLGIASQILQSLAKAEPEIRVVPTRLQEFLQGVADFLNAEVTGLNLKIPLLGKIGASVKDKQGSLSAGIAEITTKAKNSLDIKSLLNQRLGSQVDTILDLINQDLIEPAQAQLKQQGKAGLVVIIDNLDRVADVLKVGERFQPEYLFINRGESLRQLNCDKVYSIPAKLVFSNESGELTNRLGGGILPKILPMVPVELRDGSENPQGMALLRQMVLARAFPEQSPEERLQLIPEVFDSPETLDRLCKISGGHARNLLGYLYGCLIQEDPPLSRDSLEYVIREQRNRLRLTVGSNKWQLLAIVAQRKSVAGMPESPALLRSLLVFEYRNENECWHNIDPVVREIIEFKRASAAITKEG